MATESRYNIEYPSQQLLHQLAQTKNSSMNNSTSSYSLNGNEDIMIVAVIENKAREMGVACMNLKKPQIILSQFCENTSNYYLTLNFVHVYNPVEIILPLTMQHSKFVDLVRENYPKIKITFVARKLFNETKGYTFLKQYSIPSNPLATDTEITKKYLCLSCCCSLIQYVEFIQGITYMPKTIAIYFKECSGFMTVDSSSVKNLELLKNLKDGDNTNTLFSVMNFTKTAVGCKLLKTTLLQPPADISTIRTRLEHVEELMKQSEILTELDTVLQDVLVDVDHLVNIFSFSNKKKPTNVKYCQSILYNMICLKKILGTVSRLASIVQPLEGKLFEIIFKTLSNTPILDLEQVIDDYLNEEIVLSKNPLGLQNQKCFAIRSGISSLLDVAKSQYSGLITQVESHLEELVQETSIPSLKSNFSNKRGFFYSGDTEAINLSTYAKKNFIQKVKLSKRTNFSTEKLNSLNVKVKEMTEEIYLLSVNVLDGLVDKVRENISSLQKMSEGLALLDLLHSFAMLATTSNDFCKPQFTLDGPIAIKQGRHPILEKISLNGFYIPNDTFVTESSNLQIVTGANMSGKTCMLKQVALVAIMAHMGSFVPAKFASIRILDHIFTRLSTEDNIETNAGTLLVEMKEVAYILNKSTSKSLIVIDELGRSTSNIVGAALSWAVCEKLAQTKALILMATHFVQLTDLEYLYPNVRNFHMITTGSDGKLNFTYSMGEGSNTIEMYGIQLARMLNLPEDVVDQAETTCKVLMQEKKRRVAEMIKSANDDENGVNVQREKQISQLANRLISLKYSSLSGNALLSYLQQLKQQYQFLGSI